MKSHKLPDMKSRIAVVLLLLCISGTTSALNILVLNCQNSRSHFVFINVLTNALLQKGHHVYELVIAPTPKHPNRTTFAIADKIQSPLFDKLDELGKRSYIQTSYRQAVFSVENCARAFNSQAAKDLLALARDPKRRPKIDAVVIDFLFGQCLGAFAKEFGNAPIVVATAFGNPVEVDELLGAPTFPSFVPHDMTTYSRHHTMTWTERFYNKLVYLLYDYYRETVAEATMNEQIRTFFGEGAATIAEVKSNVSIAIVNSHPAIQGARPQLPAVVEVGGIHVPPLQEIPGGKLKNFLDSAQNGFMLLSLGSVLRASSMDPSRKTDLMRAFERLKPLRVVMKWDKPWNAEKDGQLPNNVFLSPWLPQSDILGHPNVRLFVSHCGLLSTHETIYRMVPVVAVPFFVDQFLNAKSLAALNIAEILPYEELNEVSFYNTVQAVLKNDSYAKSVRRLSSILRDQADSPKERAVYWVEFVARHGGAFHLRSPAEQLSWVARWMIDDVLILFVVVFGLVSAVHYLVKLCIQIHTGTERFKEE